MISVSDAKSILKQIDLLKAKMRVSIHQAQGYFLAESISSNMDVPTFDNSAMDGYAFYWQEGVKALRLVGEIQAGFSENFQLKSGEAVRIFTGAPMPKGADTVVIQEKVERQDDLLRFDPGDAAQGKNVRYQGTQCRKGDQIAFSGTKVTPGMVSLLASVGISHLHIWIPPKVTLIITGNEIIESSEVLQPGQIYNSNGPALEFWLRELGVSNICQVKVRDEKDLVIQALKNALEDSDLILFTGGISVGAYDYVRAAIEANQVVELFYKLKQRPGKPLFAGKKGHKIVFGLPGNPGPVLSCFMHYIKPLIQSWKGDSEAWEAYEELPLLAGFEKKKPLTHFLNAEKLGGKVRILQGQESFNLSSFMRASGFVEIPEDAGDLSAGDLVKFYPW